MNNPFTILFMALLTVTIGISNVYGENASNPLAAVNNTDLRVQYFDLDDADRTDYWVDGAYMLIPAMYKTSFEKMTDHNIWGWALSEIS